MTKTLTKNKNPENRVLVLMPTGRDAALVCAKLRDAEIDAQPCRNAAELERKFAEGAGAILLAEEALQIGTFEQIIESFDRQPIWSDIPVVLFARNAKNSEKLLDLVGTRLNATIVERPIRITMLLSAVLGALRARERQYQARNLLEQLKETDHQKDLFLATLSHELRTPLNSMLGWIQILRSRKHSETDFKQALEVIERNAKSQTELVSDILFISRAITGKLELKKEPVDLASIIRSAVDILLPLVEEKNIELRTSFDFECIGTMGDADRLQQVFLNLLSNAVKFTPEGGRIEVSTKCGNLSVEVEVRDTGQGIKAEFLPYVFERFRQADNSYTRSVGGLGLGLAIVHHLVRLHDGTVSVKSEGEDRGSAFTIALPILSSEDSKLSPQKSSEDFLSNDKQPQLEGIHILLVEDDEDSREMLKVMFGFSDIKITAVETAAEALDAILEIRADILISDIGLPGENGYELMQKIRKLSPEQGGLIPAIALTGYASFHDRSLALRAGYQKHLTKPVDIDELLDLVKDLIKAD